MTTTAHATIMPERLYAASPGRVFAALADPEARMRWGVPSAKVELIYDSADFRVGGVDIGRCGTRGNPVYGIETRYMDIEPDRRVVSAETVSDGPKRLSVSLITIELRPEAGGTRLVLTDQITAFDGADMIVGSEVGFSGALDNLAKELERADPGSHV